MISQMNNHIINTRPTIAIKGGLMILIICDFIGTFEKLAKKVKHNVKILLENTLKAYHGWFLAMFLRYLKNYKETVKYLKEKATSDPNYFNGVRTESQMRKFIMDQVNKIIKGDRVEVGKYEEEIIKLRPFLLDFAKFKYCGQDLDKAEDLTQDTIIKALRNQHKYDPSKAKLITWCSKIMHNLTIDNWRKENKVQKRMASMVRIGLEGDSLPEEFNIYLDANEPSPESTMDAELIKNALSNLEGKGSDMLRMRAKGYTYEEIAKHHNCPDGTVKGNINRARTRLMEQLKVLQVA